MSVKSVLACCHNVLAESARMHRGDGIGHEYMASQCTLQAEAVLKLLADLDNEQQEETSDDPA